MAVRKNIKSNWADEIAGDMQRGLLEMVTDIDTRSTILAPRLTGALVNSRKLENTGSRNNPEYTLSYGSPKVPYARLRHEYNRKNPHTIGYLSKAGDSVTRGDTGKYFRGKV